MKVYFKHSIKCFSGTVESMTYGKYKQGNLCIGRNYVMPALNANNHTKGAIVQNLALVWHAAAVDYVTDLRTYGLRNEDENVPNDRLAPTAFALFLKMMYAWYESDTEHVDLTTVTIADIVALDADVRTIARAVEAGFLPAIDVYDDLTAGIQ